MSYTLDLSDQAAKNLDRLDRPTRQRVAKRIDELVADSMGPRISRPLTGVGNLRKSRIGGWRIIFTVDRGRFAVYVVAIHGHRKASGLKKKYRRLADSKRRISSFC